MLRIRVLFLISIIFYSMNPGYGQEEEPLTLKDRREMAKDNIKKLEEGVLVIRLQSQQKKIEALQELIDGGELNKKNEKRIKAKLAGTKARMESFNKAIIAAFEQEYRFSDFLFMLDTASVRLKNDNSESVFLNRDLKIDPSVSLNNRSFFILRFGYTSRENGQSIEAMIIMNDDFEDLQPPFPYYTRINNFNNVMGGLFPKPKQEQKNANRMVENLQKRLLNFSENFQ